MVVNATQKLGAVKWDFVLYSYIQTIKVAQQEQESKSKPTTEFIDTMQNITWQNSTQYDGPKRSNS